MRANPGVAEPALPSATSGGYETEADIRRRRWVLAVLIFGIALLAVAGHTFSSAYRTVTATSSARQALHEQAAFEDLRNSIDQEYRAVQRYRMEPTSAARQEFLDAAEVVAAGLDEALESDDSRTVAGAEAVSTAQSAFRERGDLLLGMIDRGDRDQARFEREEFLPAYQRAAEEANSVLDAHGDLVRSRISGLERTHTWLFADLGLLLAAVLSLAVLTLVLAERSRDEDLTGDGPNQTEPDQLLALPSSAEFAELVRTALPGPGAARRGSHGLTVLMIGLDGIPTVVRAHGPDALGQLLIAASRRLRRLIRDDDLVARVGEREFGVLLHEITDLKAVATVTDRIEESLNRPFRIQTGVAPVRASVGVAICAPDTDPVVAVRRAAMAMNRATSLGGGIAIAESEPEPVDDQAGPTASGIDLSGELRALLHDDTADGRLTFRYQPVVRLPGDSRGRPDSPGWADGSTRADAATGAAVTDLVASVRWRHHEYGELPQRELVAAATASGLLTPLMAHLMTIAARQAAAWRAEGARLVVTLPTPSGCLGDPWFVPAVQTAVDSAGCDPALLRLEFEQAGVLAEPGMSVPALEAVRRIGVGVAISGFGTGDRSLAALDRIPADELKIPCDRLGEQSTSADRTLVRDAIELARELRITPTADGVPGVTGVSVVRDAGCDRVTGPVITEAVPADEVPEACVRARQRAWIALMRATTTPGPSRPTGTGPR